MGSKHREQRSPSPPRHSLPSHFTFMSCMFPLTEYAHLHRVRAYRSRFDKWRVHKYNCARRRAATVTATGGYQQHEGYLCGSRDVHVQRPHADCQFLTMARHYSAPDVLATER